MDLYRWLRREHIDLRLGGAHIGRLSTQMIREWRPGNRHARLGQTRR
jgi:hypothetical protein